MNVDLLSAAAIGGVIASSIIGAMLKFLLPGYLGEKGKNLATKEDIEHITDKIEAVKTQYALLVEAAKVDNQLRVAALDARLQKAQQAFTLWRKLVSATHSSHCAAVVLECQTWWEDNCLYLEPSAREAFSSAYAAANLHQSLLDNRSDAEAVMANFAKIKAAGDIIVKSVSLPGLTREEQADLNASA
jgi:hypothetical protein